MQVTKNGIDTAAGPSDWFSGAVYIDAVASPSGASRLTASSVHFTPGARTAWHSTRTARRSTSSRASAACSGAAVQSR
jgi:quercetin dioxygenase-like cupin family protein